MAELPMLAQLVELLATPVLPSPQTPAPALPTARLSARHLGTSHDSRRLPASHLDVPVASALPLSRELLSMAVVWPPSSSHLHKLLHIKCI